MQYRRSDYDVTNTVQVSSVAAVKRAVEELYSQTWPTGMVERLETAFTDFERLFNGHFPGYLGCDTVYHDLQHSLDDTLAILRLFGALPGDGLYDVTFDRYDAPNRPAYRPAQATGNHVGIDLADALLNLESFGHACAGLP